MVLLQFLSEVATIFLHTLFVTIYYWLPFGLVVAAWNIWYLLKQSDYIRLIEWSYLEIRLPKIIAKSPQAMEVAVGIFEQTFEGTWLTRLTQGIVRSWFSLELMSDGGVIHFFVVVPKFFRNLVEAQIYSQYPEVEVHEAEDYTRQVTYVGDNAEWKLWGVEMILSKPDPYPIKTYVDYGLDKDPKEEYKIDPMTPLLEFLGTAKAGEQIWIQIVVMATKDRFRVPGTNFGKQDWKKEGATLIDKLMKRDKAKEEVTNFGALTLSPGERKVVEAVERSISKTGFDCGIRAIYLAPGNAFRQFMTPGLMSSFKQFGSKDLNGLKPGKKTSFDFWWQDPTGKKLAKAKKEAFRAYVHRGFFYFPHKRKPFILNSEELATIYHFPGEVAKTPSLGHIESKRGEPPTNLPL